MCAFWRYKSSLCLVTYAPYYGSQNLSSFFRIRSLPGIWRAINIERFSAIFNRNASQHKFDFVFHKQKIMSRVVVVGSRLRWWLVCVCVWPIMEVQVHVLIHPREKSDKNNARHQFEQVGCMCVCVCVIRSRNTRIYIEWMPLNFFRMRIHSTFSIQPAPRVHIWIY